MAKRYTALPEAFRRPLAPAVCPAAVSRRMLAATLAIFTLAFALLELNRSANTSATFDEPIHLTAGYAALTRRDFRVDPSHPPLARLWAALPLLVMPHVQMNTTEIDRVTSSDWLFGRAPYDFARRFLYDQNDADRLLDAGRLMIVLLAIGTGWLLFFWAYEWLGFRTACWALAAYCLSPNLAAHAALVTTDLGATAFIFGTVYFLWRWRRHPSWPRAAALTVAFALAIVTKFSALLLVPIAGGLVIGSLRTDLRLPRRMAIGLPLALVSTSVFVIWMTYGFRYLPSSSPDWRFAIDQHSGVVETAPVLGQLVAWVDDLHLLPNAFTQGAAFFAFTELAPNRSYLLGSYSESGFWYYFPVAIAVKTPVPLLLLTIGGLAVLWRRRQTSGLADLWFVLWPVGMYGAAAMASPLNIGLRHVLPLYPFFLLIAAAGVERLVATPRPLARATLAALALWWIVGVGRAYPHYLTYFNVIAGGPADGAAYLADSNLDWGQSLKALRRWMEAEDVAHINLAYFGQADPEYYGIRATYLPGTSSEHIDPPQLPGYVVVSETILSGVYLAPEWRLFYRALQERTPVARIGNTLRVYWLDTWPDSTPGDAEEQTREAALADALLFDMDWPDHALSHYRAYIARHPTDPRPLGGLGMALMLTGDSAGGLSKLELASALSPRDGWLHRSLASALLDVRDPARAQAHASAAVSLQPNDGIAHQLLGRSLAAQNQWAAAAFALTRAVALHAPETAKADLDVVSAHLSPEERQAVAR